MNEDNILCNIFNRPANATAFVVGSEKYTDIRGKILFYQLKNSVLVRCEIIGLPIKEGRCKNPFFAMHIHSGSECSGDDKDYFSKSNGHYNPEGCPHPYHAGDLPPLFSVKGNAFTVFLTDRITVSEVLYKTLIIHSAPDDFTTQPSGNAGEKIACGVITPTLRYM